MHVKLLRHMCVAHSSSNNRLLCCTQIMKTDFVPKLVAGVSACSAVYAVVTVADRLLTVKTLASVGYFDALVRPALLCDELYAIWSIVSKGD